MQNELIYQLKFDDQEPLDDYRNCNTKTLKIQGLFQEAIIVSQNVHIGKGGILWDASYIMAKILLNQQLFPEISSHTPLDVIQLGAGTGLPSVVLCKKSHRVVSTDIPKLLPVIQASFQLNKPINTEYHIKALQWGNSQHIQSALECLSEDKKSFDLIIAADLIYLEQLFEDLIQTFKQLSCSKTKILISYRIRMPSLVDKFLQTLKNGGFSWSQVDSQILHAIHPNKAERFIIAYIIK